MTRVCVCVYIMSVSKCVSETGCVRVCDIIWLRIAAGWVIVFVIRSVAAIKMCTDKELTMHASIGYCYFCILSKGNF